MVGTAVRKICRRQGHVFEMTELACARQQSRERAGPGGWQSWQPPEGETM